jgi:hypothetical protein
MQQSEEKQNPQETQGSLFDIIENKSRKQKRDDCPKYEICGAPLCPLANNELAKNVWYPDEEICAARKFARMPWVRKQKLIAKKYGSADRYFTVRMLDAVARVIRGIEGANPDNPDGEESWFETRKSRTAEGKRAD